MNHSFNIPISVTTEQCQSVLTTATDMGGIHYWDLPFRNRVRDEELNCISFEVKCNDAIDPYWDKPIESWVVVDEFTVLRGLRAIAEGKVKISDYTRRGILALLGDPEVDEGISMCDLDQADAILQIGLFGELVYG